jgi:hypothetical protein
MMHLSLSLFRHDVRDASSDGIERFVIFFFTSSETDRGTEDVNTDISEEKTGKKKKREEKT